MLKVARVVSSQFNVKDMEKMLSYYTETLGMNLVERADDGNAYISSGTDHHNVVLVPANESGLKTLSYEIKTEYSLKEVVSYFRNNDIPAELKTDAELGIPELVEMKDPDGNIINLFPESQKIGIGYNWEGIVPNRLGHVALNVNDVKKTAQFYEKFLGFKESDWMSDFFVFMRCSQDHHNMNFIQNKNAKKMNHIAFELRDSAHIQLSSDILYKHGKKLIWGPVRHGIGHNISTYHLDDEGNMIELFCELDIMNEELGYFEPRPYHEDFPQRPKVWDDIPLSASVWGPQAPDAFLD